MENWIFPSFEVLVLVEEKEHYKPAEEAKFKRKKPKQVSKFWPSWLNILREAFKTILSSQHLITSVF